MFLPRVIVLVLTVTLVTSALQTREDVNLITKPAEKDIIGVDALNEDDLWDIMDSDDMTEESDDQDDKSLEDIKDATPGYRRRRSKDAKPWGGRRRRWYIFNHKVGKKDAIISDAAPAKKAAKPAKKSAAVKNPANHLKYIEMIKAAIAPKKPAKKKM